LRSRGAEEPRSRGVEESVSSFFESRRSFLAAQSNEALKEKEKEKGESEGLPPALGLVMLSV